MQTAVAESLDALRPHLTSALVRPDAMLDLKALASHLAPILQGGFECRLRANSPRVDLQQCIVPDDSELGQLQALVAAASAAEGSIPSGWSRLQGFLAAWSESSSLLRQHIPEIWLEFDVKPALLDLPMPAIFFALSQDISPAVDTYETAALALDLLLGSWHNWRTSLYQCFATCPHGAFVSHIGVMLSRNAPALRVNVKRLQPDSLMLYLQRNDWPGDVKAVTGLMQQLFAYADRITVCLDVGHQVETYLGFECIFLKQPHENSRWADFLDDLVQRGLCELAKRDALLNWPGQTTPLNTSAPWPSHLVAASLLQPRGCFTMFDRRLSHIKVSWQPQHGLEAKAYLWFQHQWFSGVHLS